MSANIEGLYRNDADHYPKKLPQRARCVICHNKIRWSCKKCKNRSALKKIVLENITRKWPLHQFGYTPLMSLCILRFCFFLVF